MTPEAAAVAYAAALADRLLRDDDADCYRWLLAAGRYPADYHDAATAEFGSDWVAADTLIITPLGTDPCVVPDAVYAELAGGREISWPFGAFKRYPSFAAAVAAAVSAWRAMPVRARRELLTEAGVE